MRFFFTPMATAPAGRACVLYFAVALLTQRWALLRLHRLPEHDFDDRVLSRMVKWAKYIFLVHLIAVYATVRTLPQPCPLTLP